MECNLNAIIAEVSTRATGWPLMIFLIFMSLFCSYAFRFVQFRHFLDSWRVTLFPSKSSESSQAVLSPLQAFLNSLGMSLGNGTIAGVATSIYAGGPGSIFWMGAMGILLMVLRFAEVYLSMHYQEKDAHVGGPMLYIKRVFGSWPAYIYALLALSYAYVVGNAIQVNAISLSLQTCLQIDPWIVACVFSASSLYIMLGGAKLIMKLSDAIVPLKVVLFFLSVIAMFVYHWQSLLPSCWLIIKSAFSNSAFLGGTLGFSLQQAMRFGIFRSVMSTEAGLGTSGILFGSSESEQPVEDAFMGMLTTFISTVISVLMGLAIISSGAWSSGFTSTALTIVSFQTLFGPFGGAIVSILAFTFGIGLIVSYGFIAQSVWFYVTGGRYRLAGVALYVLFSCVGALANPLVLWLLGDIINVGMVLLNVSAIFMLHRVIQVALEKYEYAVRKRKALEALATLQEDQNSEDTPELEYPEGSDDERLF